MLEASLKSFRVLMSALESDKDEDAGGEDGWSRRESRQIRWDDRDGVKERGWSGRKCCRRLLNRKRRGLYI